MSVEGEYRLRREIIDEFGTVFESRAVHSRGIITVRSRALYTCD
jgi:hypothetical protein